MNDLELLWELAQETSLPALAELGAARASLVAAIATDPPTERSTTGATPSAQPTWRRSSPRRQLVLTAMAAAAVSALVAAVLVSAGGRPAGNARSRVDAAAARVLHSAALAAMQLQAGAPRPDQFIYMKIQDGTGGAGLYRAWLSVDGTRTGLVRGAGGRGPANIYVPGCRGGRQLRVMAPAAEGGTPGGQNCVPQPAYFPDMPGNLHALRAYLKRTRGINPGSPGYLNDFGKTVDELLSQAYLSSDQRAALYDLMAQTPGFTLIPHVADSKRRQGVGIAWPAGGGKTMIIFNAGTYAELGIATWGVLGQKGTDALLKLAIVNEAGQLP
jgi:hypothetical protein